MKWPLKLDRIDDTGILQSTVVGLIERPELIRAFAAGKFPRTEKMRFGKRYAAATA